MKNFFRGGLFFVKLEVDPIFLQAIFLSIVFRRCILPITVFLVQEYNIFLRSIKAGGRHIGDAAEIRNREHAGDQQAGIHGARKHMESSSVASAGIR